MLRLFQFIILISLFNIAFASDDNFPAGSRQAAMGGCGVGMFDLWSSYHNQAGLAWLTSPAIGIHHENRYILEEKSLSAITAVLPSKLGNFGVNLNYYGYDYYHESKIAISYSKSLGKYVSAALQFDYLHTFVAEEYGNVGNIIFEAGLQIRPADNLTFGAHAYNPAQTKNEQFNGEKIPTIYRVGLAYQIIQDLLLITAEWEKDLAFEDTFRFGAEAEVVSNVFLRTGFITEPSQFTFGAGYNFNNLRADIAFTNHQPIGITPHFTISYVFN